jgi:DNA-binding NarL/FixJ family response regulator
MAMETAAIMVSLPGPARRGTLVSIDAVRRRRSRRGTTGDVIRVLLVGGHELARAGLRRLMDDEPGQSVVGDAPADADSAQLIHALNPHVVLIDAGASEPDPAETTRRLGGHPAVLLLTEGDADERLLAAMRAGATGVLAKNSHPDQLAAAVRTLAGGGVLLPARAVRRLVSEQPGPSTPPAR